MIREERSRRQPARVGVFQAIRRYPLVVLFPMIVLAALGGALGWVRQPNYTATSQLAVGALNVADPAAIGSVVEATNSLASVYSRMVKSAEVGQEIRRTVGADAIGSSVSATPVPESPLVKVSATSSSKSKAIRVANAASVALTEYAQRASDPSGGQDAVRTRFRAAALRVAQREDRVRDLKRELGRSPSDADARELNEAEADLQDAILLREGYRANYTTSQQTKRSTPALRPFVSARGATSDRARITQILALLGLIAGGALGAALATARLNRRVARLTRP